MKAKRLLSWVALGLTLLLVSHALIAVENYNISIAEPVLLGAEAKYGPTAPRRILAWSKLITSSKKKSVTEKLELVNDFFNRIPFKSDMELWGKRNYWPTPVEMLARNGGGHSAFATSKYFSLLALGVRIDQLQITYVTATNLPPADQAHMVLTYYATPDAMPLVLDNLDGEVKPANERNDLIPIYSFNGDGLWLSSARSEGKSAASANTDLWHEMNFRRGKEFLSVD